MIDGSYLKGACVRDHSGETGRLLSILPAKVVIGWALPDTTVQREETLSRTEDRFRYGVEILTLDRGWAPLGLVLPSYTSATADLVAEMRSILEDHNPFQNKSRLGPGPRGSRLTKARRWRCHGENYTQTCVGIADDNHGQTITIRIDPEYKSAYNKLYKRFVFNKERRRRRRR